MSTECNQEAPGWGKERRMREEAEEEETKGVN